MMTVSMAFFSLSGEVFTAAAFVTLFQLHSTSNHPIYHRAQRFCNNFNNAHIFGNQFQLAKFQKKILD